MKNKPEKVMEATRDKSVTISEADNGFVISCYGEKKEEKKVARDLKEALSMAEEMLGGKKKGWSSAELKSL